MAHSASQDHFLRLARLLDLEWKAEAEQFQERRRLRPEQPVSARGDSLRALVIADESSGLGGRCILTLSRRDRAARLPFHRLEPGSPVLLSTEDGKESWPAVVCERDDTFLRIALHEPPETEARSGFRVDLSADEVSRQRQRAALDQARHAQRERLAELREVLVGGEPPRVGAVQGLHPLDAALDDSQREAVAFALASQDVAVLHGPPGTGKTTALVELLRQAVRRGERVLACAPSNLAVDNLLERLLLHGEPALRLGHPARVLPSLRAHTLDLLVEEHSDSRLAQKLTREAFALFRQAKRFTRAKPEPGARRELRGEAREMLRDARRLEAQIVEHLLSSARIVCSTLTGLDAAFLGKQAFDLAVIDEAGQATEPACWLPLVRSGRLVLAGDHCQLPPTILSREAQEGGFGVSMMERLVARHGAAVTRRLDVQYRMHRSIMAFPSAQLYEGTLQAHSSVAGHLLSGLPGVAAVPLTTTAVEVIDTAGAGWDEEMEPGGESRRNPREADLVCQKAQALLEAGVSASDIAIIAPYSAQVRLLRERLGETGVEIDSVDGFQGREKEAVLLSLVRSNPQSEIGFLGDIRRMNVAMTRARRKLLVVGDSATLSAHPFYQAFFAHCEETGAYRSVWEEGA
ncbi:MAG: AAA domain-containing protein [Gemmataceae bacterium]